MYIASETANGHLGLSAKRTTFDKSRKTYLICVFADFGNVDNLITIFHKLKKLFPKSYHSKINFKPDIFSDLKINKNNKWKISPFLFEHQK